MPLRILSLAPAWCKSSNFVQPLELSKNCKGKDKKLLRFPKFMFFSFVYLFWMDPDLDPPSIIMSSLLSSSLNNLVRKNSTINSKILSKITMKNFKNLKYLKYLLTVIKQFYILVYAWVSYPSPRFLQFFTISPPPLPTSRIFDLLVYCIHVLGIKTAHAILGSIGYNIQNLSFPCCYHHTSMAAALCMDRTLVATLHLQYLKNTSLNWDWMRICF